MHLKDYERIKTLVKERAFDRALKEIELQKQLGIEDYLIESLLVQIYQEKGMLDKAQEILTNTNDKRLQIQEIGIEIQNGEIEKARKKLKKIMNINNDIIAINNLGLLSEKEGDQEEAKNYYEYSLNIEPNNPYALQGLARISIREKDYTKAKNYYYQILELGDNLVDAHEKRKTSKKETIKIGIIGMIYLEIKIGHLKQAQKFLEQLLKLDNIYTTDERKISFYLNYKLNPKSIEKIDKRLLKYDEKQIVNYNEEKAKKHIKIHKYKIKDKKDHTTFYKKINTDEIFEIAKEKIKDIDPITSTITDRYVIELNYFVSTINNQRTNKIMVVTEVNTKNIMTLYPVPIFLESKSKSEKENEYTGYQRTRKSQIEKFNEKYKM